MNTRVQREWKLAVWDSVLIVGVVALCIFGPNSVRADCINDFAAWNLTFSVDGSAVAPPLDGLNFEFMGDYNYDVVLTATRVVDCNSDSPLYFRIERPHWYGWYDQQGTVSLSVDGDVVATRDYMQLPTTEPFDVPLNNSLGQPQAFLIQLRFDFHSVGWLDILAPKIVCDSELNIDYACKRVTDLMPPPIADLAITRCAFGGGLEMPPCSGTTADGRSSLYVKGPFNTGPTYSLDPGNGTLADPEAPDVRASTITMTWPKTWVIYTPPEVFDRNSGDYSLDERQIMIHARDGQGQIRNIPVNLSRAKMSHYVDRLGWKSLPARVLLAEGTAAANLDGCFKVCADSSTVSLISVKHDVEMDTSHFRLRIEEDPLGILPSYYGKQESPTGIALAPNEIAFRYHHPWNPPPSTLMYLPVNVQILDDQEGTADDVIVAEFPVRIYRAPVVLVHGWTGDEISMAGLQGALLASGMWSDDMVMNIGYQSESVKSFFENRNIVPSRISRELSWCWSKGYAAGAVDLVGHSMGGILARLYLQSSWRGFEYNGDINRLITIDTPHSGSQAAGLLHEVVNSSGGYCGAELENARLLVDALEYWGGLPGAYRGAAAADLSVDSAAILSALNGSRLNRKTVPTRAIACEGTVTDFLAQYRTTSALQFGALWVLAAANAMPFHLLSQTLVDELFLGESSDAIVPLSSQIGGVSRFGGPFSATAHGSAPSNSDVKDDVLLALNTSPDDGDMWSRAGFAPPSLEYVPFCQAAKLSGYSNSFQEPKQLVQGGMVTAPASATPGSTVQIAVAGPPGTTSLALMWRAVAAGDSLVLVAAQDYAFDTRIPVAAAGAVRVLAIASGPAGILGLDSVEISVAVPAALDSLEFRSRGAVELIAGEQSLVPLYGCFADSVTRVINYTQGIDWTSTDSSVATVDAFGIVSGVMAGDAVIQAIFQGHAAVVAVHIVADQSVAATPPVDEQNQDGTITLRVSPNPGRGRFLLNFSMPNASNAKIEVFDLAGHRIRSLHNGHLSDGSQGVLWDGRDRRGAAVASGTYYFRVQVGTKVAVKSVVLLR